MSTSSIVKSLAKQSEELSRDLDSFSDRAFELQRLAKALQERSGRECADKATQVETTAVGAPVYQLERAKRLAPFAFTPCDRKLNWRKLRALNLERVVHESDARSLMELYGEVAYADLGGESVYDMTEANLLKLVRVLQLLLQVQQHRLEAAAGQQEALREEAVATAGLLRVLPELGVGGLQEGLRKLQGDFYKVADADMDAMFAQVRTEERTAARDTLAGQVDQVKQVLDLSVFGGGDGVGSAGGSGPGGGGSHGQSAAAPGMAAAAAAAAAAAGGMAAGTMAAEASRASARRFGGLGPAGSSGIGAGGMGLGGV